MHLEYKGEFGINKRPKDLLVCPNCGSRHSVTNNYCATCGQALSASASSNQDCGAPQLGDRRQLTVLFCDLVGSTRLSTQYDPEVLRERLLRPFKETCTQVIQANNGHVEQYLGDGVLAYFGYPFAYENNAEFAVDAALEMVQKVSLIDTSVRLHVHIGVATGLVVVSDRRRDPGFGGAVGDTPNRAAKLQGLAEPGEILIDAATHQLVGRLFSYQDRKRLNVKGFDTPIDVWGVTKKSDIDDRFDAARSSTLTTFVGRHKDVENLLNAWSEAKSDGGKVVLLGGEPGIGKSRLCLQLEERLTAEHYYRIRVSGSPNHADSAFYPVTHYIERVAGIARDDLHQTRLEKLERLTERFEQLPRDTIDLVSDLVSIQAADVDDRPLTQDARSRRKKKQLMTLFVNVLLNLSRDMPVLLVVEDAHWIDPSTLELLDRLVNRCAEGRILTIVAHRLEFDPPWIDHPNVIRLVVERLSLEESTRLVEYVDAAHDLEPERISEIISNADGVPLFIEECTKAVLEAPSDQFSIPRTLRDSLAARLDALETDKAVVQTCAVIGRTFSYELLALVSELSTDDLLESVQRIEDKQMIRKRGSSNEVSYSFSHALAQGAALESLLISQRSKLHLKVGKALESEFPEVVAREPELLAEHFAAAGLAVSAARYWLASGARAWSRSATAETIAHYRKALAVLDSAPPKERADLELLLEIALGWALQSHLGYGGAGNDQPFRRALELCNVPGKPNAGERFTALTGLFGHELGRGDMKAARKVATDLAGFADVLSGNPKVPRPVIDSCTMWSHACFTAYSANHSDFHEAVARVESVLALYSEDIHAQNVYESNHDARGLSLLYYGYALWVLGYAERAIKEVQAEEHRIRELGHLYSLSHALTWGAVVYQFRNEPAIMQKKVEEGIQLAERHGYPYQIRCGRCMLGWTLAAQGDREFGLNMMADGLQELKECGSLLGFPYLQTLYAEQLGTAGRIDQALETIDACLAYTDASGQRIYEAETLRTKGNLLLIADPSDGSAAESYLRQAIDVAKAQGAKAWELRATTCEAQLIVARGNRIAARTILEPVVTWFKDKQETEDYQAASRLLAELA